MMNTIKNITPLGWIGIILLLNGTLIGGVNYLHNLFGEVTVQDIVSVAGLGNMFFGGLVTLFSSQGSLIKQVSNMTGVEPIQINAQASAAITKIATDPTVPNVTTKGA